MEKQVIIRDDYELQAADYNNIQDWSTERVDHAVKDGIDPGYKFTGFQAAISGAAEVTLTAGRLYKAGVTYARDDAVILDLISKLPLATKRIIAVTAIGSEPEDDTQTRDYLTDPENNVTEPRSVAMRKRRYANVGTVDGTEAATPTKPIVDSTQLTICWVTLSTTGVDSIEMASGNYLPSVYGNHQRLNAVETWRTQVGQRLDTIGSDITALANQQVGVAAAVDLSYLMADVARLKELNDLPDDYSDYGADRFSDGDESDTTNVNYLAEIDEGVRFSKEAWDQSQLAVFNPLSSDISISSNFVLPAYDEVQRLDSGDHAAELSVSQYQYQTHEMVKKTIVRRRWRWGWRWYWWPSSFASVRYQYDAVYRAYVRVGDSWVARTSLVPWPYSWYYPYRYRGYWYDTVRVSYWDEVTVDHNVAGSQIAQTFLNSQDGWLTSIDLYFTQADSNGNVDVVICETEAGRPKLDAVIMQTTLDVGDIIAKTDGSSATNVVIPATFLNAGQRYAMVLTTAGNHYISTVQGSQYAEGTLFYSTDGAFFQGDLTKDVHFSLNFASFRAARIEVPFEPLSLSGGVTDIDINADIVVPEACEFHWEVQTPDGNWHTLGETNTNFLAGLPALLQLRGVYLGTSDVMPGVNLSGSVVDISRPRTSLRHISTEITLASATQDLTLIVRTAGYDSGNHTLDVKIDAGSGLIAPASHTIKDAGNGVHDHTIQYTPTELAAAIDTFIIDIQGTTSSALDTFSITERVHVSG